MKSLFFPLIFLVAIFVANAQNIRYVKPVSTGSGDGTSWANASHDLQAMMNSLKGTGGQVWVAQGTYKPLHKVADITAYGDSTIDRHKSFALVKDVEVYGGFQGISTETALYHRNWDNYKTILSGDIGIQGDSTDNSFHVVISAGDAGTACLDGFTVTGGNALNSFHSLVIHVNTCIVRSGEGGGFLILDSSPLIKNVIIENNIASMGGGICCSTHSNTTLQLINLIIRNNKAENHGGIHASGNSSIVIVNTIINHNMSDYGGCISSYYCPSFTIINTIISNNIIDSLASGFINNVGGTMTITNTIISNNTILNGGHGIIYNATYANMEITNTLINNNEISCPYNDYNYESAIIKNERSFLVITNSTIANNYISCDSLDLISNIGRKSYADYYHSYLYIRNSILWDHNGGEVKNNEYTVYEYKNSITGGKYGGVLQGVDPLFVDESAQNYQLQPCSPAIDKGNNAFYSPSNLPDLSDITTDLDDNPRFYNNGIVDIGAYEYQGMSDLFPDVKIAKTRTVCYGDTVDITFTLTGTSDWDLVYIVNNEFSYDTISNIIISSPYIIKEVFTSTTTYKLVSVSNNICKKILSNGITVIVIPELSLAGAIISDTLCSGEKTEAIIFESNASWEWKIISGDTTTGIPLGKQTGNFDEYTLKNNTTTPLTSFIKVFPYYSQNNIYCQGHDTNFSLTVLPEPKLYTMFFNDTLCSGERTKAIDFTGMVTQYQWENKGYSIAGIPTGVQTGNFGSYIIENKTNQEQEAIITVTPQYRLGTKLCLGKESSFNLLVYPQTQIHSINRNKFIYCEEETVELQAEATGADLSYQWYHNNNLLAGATNDFYIIPTVSRQDMGSYYVEVAGKCGTEKVDINIAVSSDKMLVEKWNDVILVDNSTYEYYGYQWYRDNMPIAGATQQFYQEWRGLNGCYSVELTLANGQKERSCEHCIDNKINKSLNIYPNPLQEGNNLQIQTEDEIISIHLYSIEGKLIRIGNPATKRLATIGLQQGIYIVVISTQDKVIYNKKIVVY
jgi:hypothetical protein